MKAHTTSIIFQSSRHGFSLPKIDTAVIQKLLRTPLERMSTKIFKS